MTDRRRKDCRARFNRHLVRAVTFGLALFAVASCVERETPQDPVIAKRELKKLGVNCDSPALLTSAEKGNKRVLELLLNAGVDPNAQGASGETALMRAASYGHVGIVNLLLVRGADTRVTNDEGSTALHIAAAGPFSYACVKALLDHGASPDARTNTGDTPLGRAVIVPLKVPTAEFIDRNYINIVKALLEHGADVNAKLARGVTPLMRAAIVGHPDMVRLLLDHGADPKSKSDEGKTPQGYALLHHNDDIARMIDGSIN